MSSAQQEASPDQQRAELPKLAKRFGCKIIREYYEPGISGDATDRRVVFQQMVRDAEEKGDFAAILCWDQDRFGRFDPIEAGRWIYPLREAGVRLITVGQGEIDWGTFAGRIIYMVQQEGKHQFLIDLSRNVLRGKIESAKKGGGSTVPPYGYDRAFYDQDGKFVKRVPYGEKFRKPKGWSMRFVAAEDQQVVDAVRWIFETYVFSDCGLGWLASDLNQRGVPSPQGKTWSVQTIDKILSNVVYTGASKFGEKRHGQYHHMGAGSEITIGPGRYADGEAIVVPGIHDALISLDIFEQAQAKRLERSSEGKKPRYSRYLLSGLMKCGHCGGPMVGRSMDRGKTYRYYICVNGATRPGMCKRYQIRQQAIEAHVLGIVEKEVFSERAADKIVEYYHKLAREKPKFRSMAKRLKTQLDALDKKISKGTENLLLASSAEDRLDMSRLLGEWRKARDSLQKQLEQVAVSPDNNTPDDRKEQALRILRQMQENLRSGDPLAIRAVLKTFVKEIRLWWELYGTRTNRFAYGTLEINKQLHYLSTGNRGR